MLQQQKQNVLLRIADIIAGLAVLCAPFDLLWTIYQNERGSAVFNTEFCIETYSIFLAIPGAVWVLFRMAITPRGRYWFVDKFKNDWRFRLLTAVVLVGGS